MSQSGPATALGAGLLSLALAVFLSACSTLDPAAARIQDGQLVFAFCTAFEAGVIEVTSRSEGTPAPPPSIVWSAEGEGVLGEGEVVTFGIAPEGFESSVVSAKFVAKSVDIRVNVRRLDASGHTVSAMSAGFDGAALEETRWLRQDGTYSDEPC